MLNIIIINGKLIQIFSVKDDSRIHPPLWRAVIGSTVSYKCISAGNTRWYYKYFDTMPISLADFLTVKSVTLENAAWVGVAGACCSVYNKLIPLMGPKVPG